MLDACVDSVLAAGGADHVIVVDNGGRAIVDAERGSGAPGAKPRIRSRRQRRLPSAPRNSGPPTWPCSTTTSRSTWGGCGRSSKHWTPTPRAGQCNPSCCSPAPTRPASTASASPSERMAREPTSGTTRSTGHRSRQIARSIAFTGGAVLFRAQFLQATGGFDESYFLYYEDVDLAYRGAAMGWAYRCVPASTVRHRVSASTSQLGDSARYLQERNRLRFAFRFGDAGMVARALWLSIRRLRWNPRRAHARALLAGIGRAPAASWPASAPADPLFRCDLRRVAVCDCCLKTSSVV